MRQYLTIATLLLILFLMAFGLTIIGNNSAIIFWPIIAMLLSFLFTWTLLVLAQKNKIEANILLDKSSFLRIHIILFILILILTFLLGSVFIEIEWVEERFFWSDWMFPAIYILVIPFMLALSPITFVLHDRKFALTYFWGWCLIFCAPVLTAIFLLIPLPIYYPLIRWFTRSLKNRYPLHPTL